MSQSLKKLNKKFPALRHRVNEREYLDKQIAELESAISKLKLAKESTMLNRYNHLSRARKHVDNVHFNTALLLDSIENKHATENDEKYLDDKNRVLFRPIS